MKKSKLVFPIASAAIVAVIFMIVVQGCEKDTANKTYTTNESVLIAEYLEENPDTYGEFYKILEATNSVSFLNAYGRYTCFAPTNDAVLEYYEKNGKLSIDDYTSDDDILTLKQVVAYHICVDSIATSDFIDGGLSDTTMSGDYLITSFGEGGLDSIMINEEALVVEKDISTSNGIIHGIDNVLDPVIKSVAELIADNEEYSIFTEALKATTLYDTLDDKTLNYTVFAEADSIFAKSDIYSLEDLLYAYSHTGDPTNTADSLYLWVAYHCIAQTLFLSDLENITYENLTHSILFSVTPESEILINESSINLDASNNTAKNGVYHVMSDLIEFVAVPIAIYYEIVDKPEIQALTDYYRQKTISPIPGDLLPDGVDGIRVEDGDYWKCGYQKSHTYRDYFEYKFDAAEGRLWFEFDTPNLVKGGEYKVWICGKSVDGGRASGNVYWDGEFVYTLDMGQEFDEDDEENGIKLYTESLSSQFVGYLIGTFEITEEGSHVIKITIETEGYMTLDMIHFIPVDEDQTAVKFENG